jgi:hypothetical protein
MEGKGDWRWVAERRMGLTLSVKMSGVAPEASASLRRAKRWRSHPPPIRALCCEKKRTVKHSKDQAGKR